MKCPLPHALHKFKIRDWTVTRTVPVTISRWHQRTCCLFSNGYLHQPYPQLVVRLSDKIEPKTRNLLRALTYPRTPGLHTASSVQTQTVLR